MTKLIVGLGNPGPQYEYTRHNIGFLILDALADFHRIAINRQKFHSEFGEYLTKDGEKIFLIKPQTFMNRSGDSVRAWFNFLKVDFSDLLVIHDELDIPLGKFKAQKDAGAAGHRGVQSIVDNLGKNSFSRLRVGIGRPTTAQPVVDFVLNPFKGEEVPMLSEINAKAVQAIQVFLEKGLDPMAQMVNTRA